MKLVSKRILAWLLVLGMVVPAMGMPAYGEEQVVMDGNQATVAAGQDSGTGSESEAESEKVVPEINTNREIQDDFHNQYGIVLYQEGRLSCEDESVTFTHDVKSDNLIVSGSYESMKNARFLIDKEFDFGDQVVGRFSVDMAAKKKSSVMIGFYLDDEEEPFATARLKNQKTDDNWSVIKNISFDVYDMKLVGKHKLSFAVLENEKAGKNVEFCFGAVEWVKSSVPVLYFDIDDSLGTVGEMNGSPDHSAECYGQMNIRVPEGYEGEYGAVAPGLKSYELDYIRGRGNSTWGENKKPYKVKLEKKADLLGMGKQKHWVLIANYFDNSLLRNKFTYWMGEQINKEIPNVYEFTPASVAVDVVMNGEYYGSYYLCEQIRVGENRVELRDLEDYPEAEDEATISGGYLLALEGFGEKGKAAFTTKKGVNVQVESPTFEDKVNQAQVKYIEDYFQKTENAIYGSDFKDEDGTSYKDLMDINSTAFYYLMQEFSKNGDAFINTSTYLFKKPDVYDENGVLQEKGKLCWGPIWDFDYVAWGSIEYSALSTEEFTHQTDVWFERLFEDPEFCKAVVEVAWPALREKLEEAIADGGQLDQYYAQIESSADYNFEKWGFSPLEYNYEESETGIPYVLTYEEELARLKEWVRCRIQWVDANVDILSPKDCTITFPDTRLKTRVGLQGRDFNDMPAAPKKKGYTFKGWELKYHYSYEEFMKALGLSSYAELVENFGKAEAKNIKANGYDENASFTGSIITLPGTGLVEARAVYVKNSEITFPTKLAFAKKQMNFVPDDIGNYYYISLGTAPYDTDYFALNWSSSNEKVASAADGKLTIHGSGTCTIRVESGNGLSASCKVKVYSEKDMRDMDYYSLYPSGFQLEKDHLTLNVGSYSMLRVKVLPETAVYQDSTLYTSDSSVVEVDAAGMLYGVSEGSCLVYTYTDSDFQACRVTVRDPNKIHTGDTFTRKGLSYKVTSAGKGSVTCLGASKKSVSSVTIPTTFTYKDKKLSVTRVKAEAFKSYKELKTVVIGSKVTSIGKKAFYNCRKLESVTMNKSVVSIGSQAFYNCKALKILRMKSAFPRMYSKAFSRISSNVKIYVPKKWLTYYRTYFKKKKVIAKY